MLLLVRLRLVHIICLLIKTSGVYLSVRYVLFFRDVFEQNKIPENMISNEFNFKNENFRIVTFSKNDFERILQE